MNSIIRNTQLYQNVLNIITDKKQMKKIVTRIDALTIKFKIRKVLMNTKSTIINRNKALEKQRLKIIKQLKNLKDNQEYQCEFKLCEVWDDDGRIEALQSDYPDSQIYEQMLEESEKDLEQIKKDDKDLSTIIQDLKENGLNHFKELQQIQQLNFSDIKKKVHEVKDIYEDGTLKLDKLNQIYNQFYNLSLQPCGICLVEPKIHQVVILSCGHCLCDACFEGFRTSARDKNCFRRCPFCRQQIEFIVNEVIQQKQEIKNI
ncbi:hypothetical protein pb186bvf_002733 [Paramecium bursaria]